jgi:hypothetical protein
MANVVIDIAAEYTGNKAFKQAETATQKLEKSVAKLGKQLAGVFAASKLYAFGKNAVKAFAADEKAARSLSLALANTGNAFASIEVEKFIGDLQRATGVLDDNLRPAFRTLLTATGDVKKSQDGLALALDIAAGTGKDLGAVSLALAKAYGGQTTALSRLGAGLSKATLASGDLDLITSELTKKFSGQALAAAEGYSGSIAKLAVASANAKEIIGKDLLDAMRMVAGEDGIGGATTAMESFATQIGNAIYGIGVLTKAIKSLPGAGFIGDVLAAGTQISGLGLLSRLGASSKARSAGTPAQSPGQRKAIDKANADAIKLQKTKNSLSTIDNAATARKITLTGDQQALEELKKKFDVERIGLFAALNQATDEETRMRLRSLIAIQDNDAALAGKIKAELAAAEAAGVFASAARQAALALQTSYSAGLQSFQQSEINSLTENNPTNPLTTQPVLPPMSALESFRRSESFSSYSGSSGNSGTMVVVNVAGSVTAERDLVSAITQGIYNNQASGIPINYSTSYV